MKKTFLLTLTIFIVVDMIFVLGWFGVPSKGALSAGACYADYAHFIIRPFLKDLIQCGYRKPCKTDEVALYNAQAEILTCLCQDKQSNEKTISILYNQEFHPNLPSTKTTDFICTQGTQKVDAE